MKRRALRDITTVFIVAIALASCGKPVTKGELADRNAATEVERCANQYLGHPNSGPDTEIWVMCLHVSSELAQRNKINVARQVIRQKGRNVFEGGGQELSDALIVRINRGQ
jgi:hypothetical protein